MDRLLKGAWIGLDELDHLESRESGKEQKWKGTGKGTGTTQICRKNARKALIRRN